MAYKRVTAEERTLIHRWIQDGERQNEIARRLKKSPGSISREIKRNTGCAAIGRNKHMKRHRPRPSARGRGASPNSCE